MIPHSLRPAVLDSLHAAHQGVSSMQMRAQAIVFWPGMTKDIAERRNHCSDCNRNAPSQAATPSEPGNPPSCPFEQIFADFFDFGGYHYLVVGDRLSGFTEVFQTPTGSSSSGARGLVKCLRKWFCIFGVPKQLSSDGGPEFAADVTAEFLKLWGVAHRISSAYHPQSNGRAEVAVKAVKRLMRANLGPAGTLNSDRFLKAMLNFRNTPDPDCGISPAQIVFGRPLRDNLLFADYLNGLRYSKRWQDAWAAKEDALRARFIRTSENLNKHARPLQPLIPGNKCFVHNHTGQHAKKWYYTGTVVSVLPHDKYGIKMDGTGRVTYRNRRFLRKYVPISLTVQQPTSSIPYHAERSLPVVSDVQERSVLPLVKEKPRRQTVVLKESHAPPEPEVLPPEAGVLPPLEPEVLPPEARELPPEARVLPPDPEDLPPQQSSPPSAGKCIPRREPLARRRLRDFNAPGLRELVGPNRGKQ